MADFTFESFTQYTFAGGTYTQSGGPRSTLASITDNDASSTFIEITDTLTLNGSLPFNYLGHLEIGGQPYFLEDFFGSIFLYSALPIGSASFPASFPASDLQTDPVPECFGEGTRIATPDGEVAVEDLAIGDMVLTEDGTAVPVRWVGRQTLHGVDAAARSRMVRICAGALGAGLPRRDLMLTADHAVVLGGALINASALVNGATVRWMTAAELGATFQVYHIETERHDAILAEGVPAETYIDVAGRRAFENFEDYVDRYGTERLIPPSPLPRISTARLLPPKVKALIGASREAQRRAS